VADDVINRGANRFREAAIIERCRDCLLLVDDVIVTDAIQFVGGDAGLYMRPDHSQDFTAETSGNTHLLDFIRVFYGNWHLTS